MIFRLTKEKYANALRNKEIQEQTDADGVVFTTWKKKTVENTKEDARRIDEDMMGDGLANRCNS